MVDSDNSYPNRQEAPSLTKTSGTGGCRRIVWIVTNFCGLGCLVCCGGFLWFAQQMKPNMIENDPKRIMSIANQLLRVPLPDDYVPSTARDDNNVLFFLRVAEFRRQDGQGVITFGKMRFYFDISKLTGPNPTGFRTTFGPSRYEAEFTKVDWSEVTINEKKVKVMICSGRERTTGKKVHDVMTEFEHSGETFFVMARFDDDVWDEDAFLKMLQEIQLP